MGHELKIVFLADTHLGFDYPVRPRVPMRRRGGDFFDNFRYVLDYARRTQPDFVVHGGDFFFRSRVPQSIVDLGYAELTAFAQSNIPFLLVPGNHERSRMPSSLWLTDPNIYVFDRPRTFCISASGCTVALSGFPFVREDIGHRFTAVLDETGWRESPADVKLLCMHQTVEGAQVGPADYTFRYGEDVLAISDIPPEFSLTLSGHIHRRQILTRFHSRGKQPVIYAGSLERTSFAEKDEPKGFYEIRLGQDAAGSWRVRKIDFIEVPTRLMVELDIHPGIELSELSTYLEEKIAHIDPNAILRLKCTSLAIGERLTAAYIRAVFPPSMNVELAGAFSRRRTAKRGLADDEDGEEG